MTFGGAHGPGAAHGYMMNKYIDRASMRARPSTRWPRMCVDEYLDNDMPVMGMGQPQHTDGDPRAEPTHIKQEELGVTGVYHQFQMAVEKHFYARRKKEGRVLRGCEHGGRRQHRAGRPWLLAQRRLVHRLRHPRLQLRRPRPVDHQKGRAWAASKQEPMVQMLDLSMIKYVGPADREVPSQEERQAYARKQLEEGEYKKWVI